MNGVWVVISNQKAQQRLQSYIDGGHLEDTYSLQYALQAFNDKVKSLIQEKGGHLHLLLYERIVMQVPDSVAEELPSIIRSYEEMFGDNIAAGVGLSFKEATLAAQMSQNTGRIELYDPMVHAEEANQGETQRSTPPYKLIDRNGQVTDKPPMPPTIEEDSEMSNFMVQRTMSELGMNPQPSIASQVSQQQPQFANPEDQEQQLQTNQVDQAGIEQQAAMDAENFEPSSLLEALLGHPVPEEEHDDELDDDALTPDVYNEADTQMQAQEQAEAEGLDTSEGSPLEGVLGSAVGKIPEIMEFASKDPQTFKQAMRYLNKIVDIAKKKKASKVEKKEAQDLFEELEKRFGVHGAIRGMGTHHKFPVGTRKDRKIKVRLPNGQTAWRSMASGRVKSSTGEPISVKQHNKEVKQDLT